MDTRNILLITQQPELLHGSILVAEGYEVETTWDFQEARKLWKPGKYRLVLIMTNGDGAAALEFCEEIKEADASQLIAFVSGWQAFLPGESCPDEVIAREAGPGHLVQRVSALVGPAQAG